MRKEEVSESTPVMVTIRCLAYNHEPYIRQCLDGFVRQQTNFRFEAIVHDDASQDGTATIIMEYARKYPDIIVPLIETENQYSKRDGSLRRIMNAHTKGKYTAFCEGDDYWTDPLKLQKQVDFLESHPDYGMVHGLVRVYHQESHQFEDRTIGESFHSVDDIIVRNRVVTLSVCMRTDIHRDCTSEIKPHPSWKMGDYPIWIYAAYRAKVYFMPEQFGVYRVLNNSASHSSSIRTELQFALSTYDISLYFANLYRKTYLINKIKRVTLTVLFYAYIKRNLKVDNFYWRKMKEFRIFSLKYICGALLSTTSWGRSILLNKL